MGYFRQVFAFGFLGGKMLFLFRFLFEKIGNLLEIKYHILGIFRNILI